MTPVGFEPIIPTGERPQTKVLDRKATGTGDVPMNLLSRIVRHYWNVILKQSESVVCVTGVAEVEHEGKRWVREHEEVGQR